MLNSKITPVVLAGGSGTRLWPVSRQELPKQFSRFLGEKTLFQRTLERVGDREVFDNPIIVTSAVHENTVCMQLDEIGVTPTTIICEPEGRDTAPAVALAALVKESLSGAGEILVLPSDQAIDDTSLFCDVVCDAQEFARRHFALVTFGIKPTRPDTGFGYIEAGAPYPNACGLNVRQFIEKPDLATAERLIANPSVFWNAGIFLFPSALLLSELDAHAPAIMDAVKTCVAYGKHSNGRFDPDRTAFLACTGISIDYAVMEKTNLAAIVPAPFGWSDLGSWQSVWETSNRDNTDNIIHGEAVAENCNNCLISSDGPLVGVCDLDDLVVVANRDAVLVTKREGSQGVRKLVSRLSMEGSNAVIRHPGEDRPWGRFDSLDRGDRHQVKRIRVNPGGRLSLQYHHHRAEHWVVVTGRATVTVGREVTELNPCDQVFIPKGATHRLENLTNEPVEIIEVQYGEYLGEDDIVRVEDIYGRDPGVTVQAA